MEQFFCSADASLAASEQTASSVGKKAKIFVESIEAGVASPTGETPKKSVFSSLSPLRCTRDHMVIKQEVLTGVVSITPAVSVAVAAEPAESEEAPVSAEDISSQDSSKEPVTDKENIANSIAAAAAPVVGLKRPTRGSIAFKSNSQRSLGESDSCKSK